MKKLLDTKETMEGLLNWLKQVSGLIKQEDQYNDDRER